MCETLTPCTCIAMYCTKQFIASAYHEQVTITFKSFLSRADDGFITKDHLNHRPAHH